MSVASTSSGLSFPFDGVPEPGEARTILPGIRWIRLPLPFALDHVNCWLLGDDTLIDTGVASRAGRGLLLDALGGAMPTALLVTHFHPDHAGLMGEFASRGSRVMAQPEELAMIDRLWHIDDDEYGDGYADWYSRNGIEGEAVEAARRAGNTYRSLVTELADTDSVGLIVDGDEWQVGERRFRVLEGRGHAPNMLMLHDPEDDLLIAADQVLPSISPNVSLMPRTLDPNPLASFLETLGELRVLSPDTLVLPSHGRPFRGLHERIDALSDHHQLRLEQVHDACHVPMSANDLFPILFGRRLDAQQLSFALGESAAHLAWLVAKGEIAASEEGDIRRYCRV